VIIGSIMVVFAPCFLITNEIKTLKITEIRDKVMSDKTKTISSLEDFGCDTSTYSTISNLSNITNNNPPDNSPYQTEGKDLGNFMSQPALLTHRSD
jgi:hypothetical protein